MVPLLSNLDWLSGPPPEGTPASVAPFGGHRWLGFSDEYQSARDLVEGIDRIECGSDLREKFFAFAAPYDLTRFPDADIVRHIAGRLVTGRLDPASPVQWRPPQGDAADTEPAEREEPPEEEPPLEEPPPATEEETAWIKFKVVDEQSGEPVKGVTLHVKTPDGKIRQIRTGPDGMAEISGIQPGSCSIERIVDTDALEVKAVE
ncbi:MAG: hypothetical protein AB1752_06210 [Candidatus Zixiibacteriota bacterium]